MTHPSSMCTLSLIIVFLIKTFDPIEQLFPITTLLSIIELCPIKHDFPMWIKGWAMHRGGIVFPIPGCFHVDSGSFVLWDIRPQTPDVIIVLETF